MDHTELFLQAFVEKGARSPGKVFKWKLQSAKGISQFIVPPVSGFLLPLLLLLPNKQFCSHTLKFCSTQLKLLHVFAAWDATWNSSQFLGLLLQYSLAAVRCNWRWPLLGPELEQSHETLWAQYILHSCRHCIWIILLLCCSKCLPNVHIAASVYNCQDLKSVIIKTTSSYTATTPPHMHTLSQRVFLLLLSS